MPNRRVRGKSWGSPSWVIEPWGGSMRHSAHAKRWTEDGIESLVKMGTRMKLVSGMIAVNNADT